MWFYFKPKEYNSDNPIFLEADSIEEAKTILEEKDIQDFLYLPPEEHLDIISASAYDRGCETVWFLGQFSYKEKQGISNPNEYISYQNWIKKDYGKIIIRKDYKLIKKDPKDDGAKCRICNDWYYMAQPEKDGKITCYTCKEKRKNLGIK
jgi:hypothetical protein